MGMLHALLRRTGRWRQSAAGAAFGGTPTLSFLETMTQNWLDARAKVKDAADGLGRRLRRPLVGQRRWQDSGQGRSLLRGGVAVVQSVARAWPRGDWPCVVARLRHPPLPRGAPQGRVANRRRWRTTSRV